MNNVSEQPLPKFEDYAELDIVNKCDDKVRLNSKGGVLLVMTAIVFLVIGFVLGDRVGSWYERCTAADMGAGRWVVDNKGKVSFQWFNNRFFGP